MSERTASDAKERTERQAAPTAGQTLALGSDANPYSFLISATASTTTFSPVKRASRKIRKKQQSFGDISHESFSSEINGTENKQGNVSSPIPPDEVLSNSPPQNPFKDIVKSDSQEI